MASFVIMEAPHGKAGAPEERIEVIRDGFSFWAFVFPFFWLLWHRLWIEAVLVLAAGAVTGMVGSWPAFEFMSSALAVLISLFVGLEANNLRIAAMRRRGWSESAVIEAGSRAEAELRFFAEDRDTIPLAPIAGTPQPSPRAASGRKPATASGPALGMLTWPGGR